MRAIDSLTLVSLMLVAFAGCVQGDADPERKVRVGGQPGRPVVVDTSVPVDWHERALTTDPSHDHTDPIQHANFTTPNFQVLGWDPLLTDYHGRSSAGYACGSAVERDGRRISIVPSFVSDVALVIIDVTDLERPQKLGELVMANTQVYDVALSPDLKHAMLATSPLDTGPDAANSPVEAPIATFRDACDGEERSVLGPEAGLPMGSGVVLVDIQNPRVPQITDFRPLPPAGAHSVRAYEIDGRTIVMTTPLSVGAGYITIFEILAGPSGGLLSPLSAYQAYPDLAQRGINFSPATYIHDAYIQTHPVTNQRLLYLAHGTIGLVVVDLDDLRQPQFLTHWKDFSKVNVNAGGHFIHEILPAPDVWEGRHYTFIGEECGGRPPEVPTCLITTLDTTDPSNPQFVGSWTLPADVGWSGQYMFSTHYIALVNRTLFVSTYHGGVWALDVSTDEARRLMPTIGVFSPTNVSPKPWEGFSTGATGVATLFADIEMSAPMVLDVDALPDGTLVTWDFLSGIYTVRFDATRPAPAPQPWPMGFNEG